MGLFAAHNFPGASKFRSLSRVLGARWALTPEERANLYISRMPIAVVTASLGGHP